MFFGEYPVNGLFLNKQLDEVFKSFKDMEAIIIDVRTNMGGDDTFANKVVGRLTNVKLLGHYKQEKKGKDVFGKLIPKYINPAGKFRFLKKVYLITDDKTVSAADVLALDMKQIPNVTIVGDNTNGSFSDIYSDRLPNGWVIDISNERYLSPTMINYEGKGVPVDIKAYTTFEDVKNKNDSVLLKVIRIIETIPE
jgi:C-terminal processing protease CtpA/Prc